jgi:hypothetical protein
LIASSDCRAAHVACDSILSSKMCVGVMRMQVSNIHTPLRIRVAGWKTVKTVSDPFNTARTRTG